MNGMLNLLRDDGAVLRLQFEFDGFLHHRFEIGDRQLEGLTIIRQLTPGDIDRITATLLWFNDR